MYAVPNYYKEEMWTLLEKLFPIYRTLMGDGFRSSLNVISEIIPLNVLQFSSGEQCGSWTIPPEWRVHEAYIEDLHGKRIVDYRDNIFHLWQYSSSFHGEIAREELLQHIATSEVLPSAIPLKVTYYNKNWGFSLTRQQKELLHEERYRVCIDTEFCDGFLNIGEWYLPGQEKDDVLIDAVLSCASLANNLSGVVVATFLMKLLSEKMRRYSYRLVLTPETLGPIVLYHLGKGLLNRVIGGYTMVNLAYDRKFHYRVSRNGMTLADRAMIHSLRCSRRQYTVEPFDVRTGTCGNEKAYNSLGIEVPIGSIRRSHIGSYPEYDTSKDNLHFTNKNTLFESLQICWAATQAIERERVYRHKFSGEPFLSGYGLFPKIESESDRIPYDYLMAFADGETSLLTIADKANIPASSFDEPVRLMCEKSLLVCLNKDGDV